MQLVGAEKYSPEKAEELEQHVDEQVAKGTYNLDANLALLRYYQFQPQSTKINVLAKVLLLALQQLPGNDFRTCVYLVPERLQNDDTIANIISLASALETTRFADFWAQAANSKDVLALVPGFQSAVRRYVLHVLAISFQRVSKRVLGEALRAEGQELEALIAERVKSAGWQVAGDVVVLPKNEHNTPVVVKRTQDVIRFEQVAPVLRCVTVSF